MFFSGVLRCQFKLHSHLQAVSLYLHARDRNIWYHYVGKWNNSTGAKLYRNAVRVGSSYTNPNLWFDERYQTFEIGRSNNAFSNPSFYGEAHFDELFVIEYEVSEEYIQNLYQSYFD